MLRFLLLCCFAISVSESVIAEEKPLQKILFGSCIKQDWPMPIFRQMAKERADAVIFLGDNIYADTNDMLVMHRKYQSLSNHSDFQALIHSTKAYAVWDDHDYGRNDAGADYLQKVASQAEFLKFWQVPEDSPRHQRPGTYHSVEVGPKGKRVQLLLLDTRYFRSPLKKGKSRRVGGPYVPDDDSTKTMLGEDQWEWLEGELKKPADLRIVASSVQLIASDSGQETWSNLPRERERFLKLVQETAAEGLFIISGDRHWSEFSKSEEIGNYPIYDFTSSSFNQIHLRGTPTENRYRVSETTYHLQNYGVILIDWEQKNPEIKIQIRDINGHTRIETRLKLADLRH